MKIKLLLLLCSCMISGYAQQNKSIEIDSLFLKYDEKYLSPFDDSPQQYRFCIELPFIDSYNTIYISAYKDVDSIKMGDVKDFKAYFSQDKYKDENGIFNRRLFYLDNKPKNVFLIQENRIREVLFFHTLE